MSSQRPDLATLIPSKDPAMASVLRRISVAANVSSTVVITGESGTGKELVARALHQSGSRRNGPWVAFSCATVPESLQESELFGHVRGAYTDARDNTPGLFGRANGGTLFLDEIGDAPLSIQTKLLRALQEREILPVGSSLPVPVDVRVIAATHRSLEDLVAQGTFRLDLYYRLHVFPIHIPPLRERPQDILFLAGLLSEKFAAQLHLEFKGFSGSAAEALENHCWTGNVRELQNRLEQALILDSGTPLSVASLFPERDFNPPAQIPEPLPIDVKSELPPYYQAKTSFERTYMERVLTAANGNIAEAARLAEKSRTEVYSLLRKHGLKPSSFKRASPGRYGS